MNQILIINSSKEIPLLLVDLFSELEKKGYFLHFFLAQADSELKNRGKIRKVYLGPTIKGIFSFILFLLAYPFLLFSYFFSLAYFKYSKGIKAIICLGRNEKIIFTTLAVLFKIKIIWLEAPETDYKKMPGGFLFFYRFFSCRATLVAFTSFTGVKLKNIRIPESRIKIIAPGVKLSEPGHQQNIFFNLAKAEKSNFSRKYFTLGVVTDFSLPHQIENLFQAARACLAVIPNLQIIIVGEGRRAKDEAEKKLAWLAKKLGIDNLVWFVSEQENLKKWLDGFDIFIAVGEVPKLSNLATVLKIMSAGLPIIGFHNRGFEDLILEDKSGILVEAGSSEILAQKIIELYKNKIRSRHLGEKAKELAESEFTLEKMAQEMEQLLK
ncbi:MAG: glycosyltransferase family 4 protein [Patescibacteria group bacterium]|nr:glycosyltransferase family 4 protein [Patescibacteria group bacterium]